MRRRVRDKLGKRDAVDSDVGYRSFAVVPSTINAEARTIDAVTSTENQVDVPDYVRMEIVPEVLITSGVKFPKSGQVPLLDSHDRKSIKTQLGSARNLRIENGNTVATLHFSRSAAGEEAWQSVQEGHVTDVSVGYRRLKQHRIRGAEPRMVAGRSFSGPVNVVESWRYDEVSLTPIGADDETKLRGLDPAALSFRSLSDKDEFQMNEALRNLAISKGMPADLDDDAAQRWLVENPEKFGTAKKDEKATEDTSGSRSLPTSDDIAKMIEDGTRKAFESQMATRAAFNKQVDEFCDLAGLTEESTHCRTLSDIAAVRSYLKEKQAALAESIPYGGSVRMISEGSDRLRTDIKQAITLHAVRAAVGYDDAKAEKHFPLAERSKTMHNMRHAGLYDLASEWVRAMGIDPMSLTREQVAICAMFGPDKTPGMGFRAAPGSAAYHSTGSFSSVTLDAVNKSMMIGYGEVPQTWRGPMTQGQSANDFENIHRIQLGAIPNLPVWNDSKRPDVASLADSRETYAVECRSLGIDFGYKLIMANNMGAITSTPAKLGDSAARTVNAVAWSQITSNPTMRDGKALFLATPAGNRKRSNLTTGSVSDYTAALNKMYEKMALMRGENTPEGNEPADILNLTPAYVAFPTALRGTLLQLIRSQSDPKASVAGITNINTDLVPIVEPLLDAASSTAFYTFAGGRVERVEVTFLAGQETPQVRVVMDEHTLATTYYVLQSVAAKALDHRGIQKHDGA